MDINGLESTTKNYLSAIKEIDKKRNQWQTEAKQRIIDILKSINTVYKLGWQVEEDNLIKNAESVFLIFYNKPSGISKIEHDEDKYSGKHYVKSSTYLAFKLAYNGDINVYIRFPEIEEIFEPHVQIKELDILDPFNVKEEIIFEYVKTFLEDLTAWETNNPLKPISMTTLGFKRKMD